MPLSKVIQNSVDTGVAGTGPAFSAYPSSSSQSVPNATFTKITLGTEEFDTNGNFTSSTFTPTVSGYYQINGKVVFDAVNSGTVAIASIYKNGSRYKDGSRATNNVNGAGNASLCSSVIYFNGTTDAIELYAYHTSGSGVTISGGGAYETFLNGVLVRAA